MIMSAVCGCPKVKPKKITKALFRRERNGTERNRSKKWNAEGLHSDGTTPNRTVPFQKLDLFNK